MKVDDKFITDLEKQGISDVFFTNKRIYRKKNRLVSEEPCPTSIKQKQYKISLLFSCIMLFIGVVALGVGVWKASINDYIKHNHIEKYYIKELGVSSDEIIVLYSNYLNEKSNFSLSYIDNEKHKGLYIYYVPEKRSSLNIEDLDHYIVLNNSFNNEIISIQSETFIKVSDYIEITDLQYLFIEYKYFESKYNFQILIDYEQFKTNLANKNTE